MSIFVPGVLGTGTKLPDDVCGEYLGTEERIPYFCMLKPGHKEPHNDLLAERMRKKQSSK